MADSDSKTFFSAANVDVADLERLVHSSSTELCDYPLASEVSSNVLLYDCHALLAVDAGAVRSEVARALLHGPGVLVVRGAFDRSLTLKVSDAFDAILDEQSRGTGGSSKGDHFARAGNNSRVWNTLEKLARGWPELFVSYYANEALALACEAWLGPHYQMTAQLNVMRPGAPAQLPHRDYHLGFVDAAVAAAYPIHAHTGVSPQLTLQCLVAHSDMPLASGPTCFLPHSQKYAPGYIAHGRADVRAFFDSHRVQLPLQAGDLVCMNPAVLHGAGANTVLNSRRMANLLQVSSAFGRPMETVDTARLSLSIYPALTSAVAAGRAPAPGHAAPVGAPWTDRHTSNVVAAVAAGYAFPANLDAASPGSEAGRQTEAGVMLAALREQWSAAKLQASLATIQRKGLPPPLPMPSRWGIAPLRAAPLRLASWILYRTKGCTAWVAGRLDYLQASANALLSGMLASRIRA
jgi:ectoine hydroxylase-related dioxygenase (phytanoyl-CoA dioxygenase family)